MHTDAGDQPEKFLFYRGVAAFPPPLSAVLDARGGLRVTNLGLDEIPDIILFERRGDRIGYRMSHGLQAGSLMYPPELNAGLDSWFEEGSRLFYLVPKHFVDTILPLSINPAPSQTIRVFVGRMEIVSPATQKEVQAAIKANDQAALEKYGRFLEPIMAVIEAKKSRLTGAAGMPCDPQSQPKALTAKTTKETPRELASLLRYFMLGYCLACILRSHCR